MPPGRTSSDYGHPPDVKRRYPDDTAAPVAGRHNPSGGVAAVGSTAGVGEGSVFAGAVVTHGMRTNELVTDRDLDGVTDDDLDFASPVLVADPVVRAGEAHVAGRVDLAGHGCRGHRRPGGSLRAASLDRGGLLLDGVSSRVGRDEHTAMMELREPAFADDLDGLAGQPGTGFVLRAREADRSLRADAPSRHRVACSIVGLTVGHSRWPRFGELEPFDRWHRPIDWCGRSWL